MLTGVDTVDFLSSLLEADDVVACPSRSPSGSDSGISDDSSTGPGNGKPLGCLSPEGSDTDNVPSPSYSPSSSTHSDPALLLEEVQMENQEALAVQADHCYSLIRTGDLDVDDLQSVRAEQPDTDVFIDLGKFWCSTATLLSCDMWTACHHFSPSCLPDDFVSDAMEEDFTTELPCTLSIEDSEQNISESSQTDQVRLNFFF